MGVNRRTFLATSLASLPVVSGCLSQPNDSSTADPSSTPPLSETNEEYGTHFAASGAWPTPGYDATRRGFNLGTNPPRGEVGAAWLRTPIESQLSFQTTPPVTDDERVYVGSGAGRTEGTNQRGGFIAAFDGETGTREWLTTVSRGGIEGVIHTDGTLLTVSSDYDPPEATLTALAAADGSKQWDIDLPSNPVWGPIVANDCVYVASNEDGVTAVSLDGTHQWTSQIADDDEAATRPCATDSMVFVGTEQGRVSAFSAEDGRRQWRSRVLGSGHQPRIQTMPTVVGETVFVSGTDYHLYAVNATDGTTRWETRLLDEQYGNSIPSVAVGETAIYVNTIHGGLIALRRSDGIERWRTGEGGGTLSPAVAGDVIIVPTNGGTVHAYTAPGEQRWAFEMPAFETEAMGLYIMEPEVALAHNRLYATLNDGRVFSLGAK